MIGSDVRRFGRSSVLALGLVALSVSAGVFAFVRKAEAQLSWRTHSVTYAPVVAVPVGSNSDGVTSVQIGLLLPAVKQGATPGSLQVEMGDGSVSVQLPGSGEGFAFYNVYLTLGVIGEAGGNMVLHVVNRATNQGTVLRTSSDSFVVRLLPAVQSNGVEQMPLSEGVTVKGFNNAQMADGSVLPIPFEYALPAVQLPAVQ